MPTLGFVETVSYRNIEFMVWDMGGQDKIRQLWSHYYEETQALIFVVDSADAERMDEARQELHKLMEQEELKDAVLLVYANKQDVAGALSVQQVAESLRLGDLPDSRLVPPGVRRRLRRRRRRHRRRTGWRASWPNANEVVVLVFTNIRTDLSRAAGACHTRCTSRSGAPDA